MHKKKLLLILCIAVSGLQGMNTLSKLVIPGTFRVLELRKNPVVARMLEYKTSYPHGFEVVEHHVLYRDGIAGSTFTPAAWLRSENYRVGPISTKGMNAFYLRTTEPKLESMGLGQALPEIIHHISLDHALLDVAKSFAGEGLKPEDYDRACRYGEELLFQSIERDVVSESGCLVASLHMNGLVGSLSERDIQQARFLLLVARQHGEFRNSKV